LRWSLTLDASAAASESGEPDERGEPGEPDERREPDGRVRRLLAVASAGGHWEEMSRIVRDFELDGWKISYVTTRGGFTPRCPPGAPLYVVSDAHRTRPAACLAMLGEITSILIQTWPDAVLSTGAAPGCVALALGRLLGARTAWIDSMANVQNLSLSGRLVRPFAHIWLTQWSHLSRPDGPEYAGRIF
jgi:hypothetical protein